jgi:signal-transduction protein with cAMP-binding, CBS, and nucleotidyltransferase domain
MKIRDVIRDKGPEFIAVDSSAFVDLVMEEGNLIGMFTERDVLQCWVRTHESFDKVKISDVMTKDIMIVQPDDDLNYAMTIMINKKIRHLPVVENGRVTSVISIRDMVKAQVTNLQAEVHYLRDYITGG